VLASSDLIWCVRQEVTAIASRETDMSDAGPGSPGVEGVLVRMDDVLVRLEADGDPRRFFLGTYRRTTAAVGEAIARAAFEDPAWVDRWDAVFAELYLDALAAFRSEPSSAPRPWRIALGAPERLHPLQHVLLGINAHVNYDLPQALLAVIDGEDFARPLVLARRRRDHERIDAVLAAQVAVEDAALAGAARSHAMPGRSLTDRLLQPVNRAASRRFLREARQKVWHNTDQLHQARLAGGTAYAERLAELEILSAARVADLLAPGHVLVKLGVAGFGVMLPPV
jgi:hypothetical protein